MLRRSAAAAFTITTTEGGEPRRWWLDELVYRVSVARPGELEWEVAREAIREGWRAWEAAADRCDPPTLRYGGKSRATGHTAPTFLDELGDNVVVFVHDPDDWAARGYSVHWIAVTSVTSNSLTGEIIDADIQLNDDHYVFSASEVPTGDVDLVSVVAHEAGHALGLDHAAAPGSTMYAEYANSSNPIGARTLARDDIDGICELYDIAPAPVDPGPGCAGGAAAGEAGEVLLLLLLTLAAVGRRSRRRLGM